MKQPGTWRKSSYSQGDGNCVELREDDGAVEVRDTKNRTGGTLRIHPQAWTEFTQRVARGDWEQ